MKIILSSCVHPDTNEPIPYPMRISAFVPANMPIMAGIILTPPTPMNSLFWQWLNQTYNAGLNYGNKNASMA